MAESDDKEIVGMDVGSATFPLEPGKLRELQLALGDANASEPTSPVPLIWPVLAGHYRDGERMLRKLRVDPRRLLHGSVSWEYERPVAVGSTLHADRRVTDVEWKEGRRGGRMKLISVLTTYTQKDGAVVAHQRDTYIEKETGSGPT